MSERKLQRHQNRKHQIELDTVLVITNRILDVVIMFLSVFFIIYAFNQEFKVAIICLILDLIIIPINNGPQAFKYLYHKWLQLKSNHL